MSPINQSTLTETLETMVDQWSLSEVLEHLAIVCSFKAEHLRHNWQDSPSAKLWDKDQQAILKTVNRLEH